MSSGGELSLGAVLRDWATKLVPVLVLWGITSEVRVQTLTADVARIEADVKVTSANISKSQEILTKNTVLLEHQATRIASLEKDIKELVRLLSRPKRAKAK